MTHVLSWLLLGEVLAWAWLLMAWPVFSRWPDRGFGVAKAAGVLTLAVPAWTIAWLAGAALTPALCWAITGAIALVAGVCWRRHRTEVAQFLAARRRDWVGVEALWLLTTAAFLLLRAARPAITGGEKFMDFALLNAALRSASLPLEDPWLTGFPLNYYHFGFVTWATVARMLSTPPEVAYNIAVAMVPGFVAAGACSIGLALTLSRRFALVSTIALVGLGNMAGARQAGAIGVGYDIWSPTRVIPGTINEFPFFTFLWADLHPHLLSMPSVLLCVALATVLFDEARSGSPQPRAGTAALLGASSGVAVATSAWDAIPLGILIGSVAAVRAPRIGARAAATEATAFLAVALAIVAPAARTASAAGVPVGLVAAHSPLWPFLLVQGGWLAAPAIGLAFDVAARSAARWILYAVVAMVAGVSARSPVVGLLALLAVAAWDSVRRAPRMTGVLVATAFTMLLAAELVWVDDIYGPALVRMNSVFKLHLHAIVFLALASGACVRAAWRAARGDAARVVVATACVCVALVAAVYPIGAVLSTLGRADTLTLDGTRYLEAEHPGDRAAMAFLAVQATQRAVIAEATGPPYSYSARMSVHTGIPTILGWANHERVWRRSPAMQREIDRRIEALRVLYEGDSREAAGVLREFHVRYVVVGDVERDTYPAGDFDKFDTLGRKVFDRDGTTLFELTGAVAAP